MIIFDDFLFLCVSSRVACDLRYDLLLTVYFAVFPITTCSPVLRANFSQA